MLTPKTLKLLRQAITLTKWCKSSAMAWDSEANRVVLQTSRMSRALWGGSLSLMVLYELFLICRLVQLTLFPPPNTKLSDTVILGYNVCAYAIPLSLHYCTYCRWRELPAFINGYIAFFARFKEKYITPSNEGRRNGCERLISIFHKSAYLVILQNAVILMRVPSRAFLMTSLFVDERGKLHLVPKLLFLILHLQIWLNLWSQMLTYGTILYSYLFPCITILHELSFRTGRGLTYKILQTPFEFKRLYTRIAVLQNMFNHCFQHHFFSYHKLLISAVAVFGIYGAIKIHGPRAMLTLMVASMSCGHIGIIMRQSGKLYEVSRRVQEYWKDQRAGLLFKKYLTSSRLVKVQVGDYYAVIKSTLMVVFNVIVNAAITLLLSS